LAVGLAATLIEVDTRVAPVTWYEWPLLFGSGAAGSRQMLATVAGSMMTVAGTVFSITLVVLSLASSQYSSRVLRNFLTDRTNQTVLGVFVGIFAYCLVVMRTVRGGDEGEVFIPSLAVLGGVVLAFVGIGYLIFFIHHISTSIQAAQILARISDETVCAVDHLFPEAVGDESDPEPPDPVVTRPNQRWHPVPAARSGYVQEIDAAAILAHAKEKRTVVRMDRGIGEFVVEGTPLASVLGAGEPESADIDRLRAVFAVARQRNMTQDAAFGIRQIVDIALKALSPGINDITTAVMSLDYLTAILVRVARRRIESPYRFDEGELRVLARGPTFASLVAESFDQIRENAGGNVAVLTRLFEVLGMVAEQVNSAERRAVLLSQADRTAEVVLRTVAAPTDRHAVEAVAATLEARLGRKPDGRTTRPD
jgi:uncharacterized membrane protein